MNCNNTRAIPKQIYNAVIGNSFGHDNQEKKTVIT